MRYAFTMINLFFINLLFSSQALAHGVSDSDKQAMVEGGALEYAILGAKHMVTGYDHLLFIFGVIFFLTKFGEIVKFITAFTIGHSITLVFATFMGITANAYLIDAVIAITVIYKGFDNIDGFKKYLNMKPPNMLALVFIFGLIHGFGLSTRLQELPLNKDGLLLDIISFNIGVELGQVAALSVMMVVLTGWRKTPSFKKFSDMANIALMGAGALLLVMQLHGYFTDSGHHHAERPAAVPTDTEIMFESAPAVDGKEATELQKTDIGTHSHGDGKEHTHDKEPEQKKDHHRDDSSGHSHDH